MNWIVRYFRRGTHKPVGAWTTMPMKRSDAEALTQFGSRGDADFYAVAMPFDGTEDEILKERGSPGLTHLSSE